MTSLTRETSKANLLNLLQIFIGVLVGHVGRADVELEVRPKIFKIIVVWKLCRKFFLKKQAECYWVCIKAIQILAVRKGRYK